MARPRETRVDDAVLDAVVEVLAESGYGALTIAEVAARAGVGRPSIYRRWPDKDSLAIAAIERLRPQVDDPRTGALESDLLAMFDQVAAVLEQPLHRQLIGLLVQAGGASAAFSERYYSGTLAPRRQVLRQVLERAAEAGEIAHDVDLDLVMDLIGGAWGYSLLAPVLASSTRRAQLVGLVLKAVRP